MNRLKSLQFEERTGIITVLSLDYMANENAILSSIWELCGYERGLLYGSK